MEFKLAACECPDCDKVDPRPGCRFNFYYNVGVVLDIHRKGASLCRDLHNITYGDDLLLFLYEGKCNRTYLAVLVLDGHLALPRISASVLCKTELKFAALQRPDCHEADPRLSLRFNFDNNVGIILYINCE